MSKESAYNNEIIANAEEYGFKAANLLFLEKKLSTYKSSDINKIKVNVPNLISISDKKITDHIKKYATDFEKNWQVFKNTYKAQEDKKSLGAEAKEILNSIRQSIIKAFSSENKIDLGENIAKLGAKDALLMVRSTGKEDSTEMANPGGNESLPSKNDPDTINAAIGKVVASYFGIKSLSQRLKANDDITKDPFMPVLVQTMVGESLGSDNSHNQYYSGVIYSGNGTRIQVAPGHGELIVNSLGNFDDYYVTSQEMVYSLAGVKDFRIKAEHDSKANKLSLTQVKNSDELKYNSSFSEGIAQEIHKVAKYIEEIYGMRMDIEFIYDAMTKTLNIVQARPIPEGDRAGKVPTSLSPDYLDKVVIEGGKIFKGSTITPEVNTAVIIKNAKHLIITENIGDALDIFLQNNLPIEAVVVKNWAPDTSHEAGEFSSKNIPVVQIENLDAIKELPNDLIQRKAIVVDPQRKSVFQLATGTNLREAVIEGIFQSALTEQVTINEYQFAPIDNNSYIKNVTFTDTLGSLVTKAKNDEKAASGLMSFIWQNLFKDNPDKISYSEFQKSLELLSNPPLYRGTGEQHIQALKDAVKFAYQLAHDDLISKELFIKVVLTCTELMINTNQLIGASDDNQYNNIFIEFLNVFEKLSGLFLAQVKPDALSDSVLIQLGEAKQRNISKNKLESYKSKFTTEKLEILTQLSKFDQYFLKADNKELWVKFCVDVCNQDDTEYSKNLLLLVGNIVKFGLQIQWCNTSFIEAYKSEKGNSKSVLLKLVKGVQNLCAQNQEFYEAKQIINLIEKQVPLWKEAANFEGLMKSLVQNIEQLTKLLKIDKTESGLKVLIKANLMSKLVDAMDLTIKSQEKSTHESYNDKTVQANNFKALLKTFYTLMEAFQNDNDFNQIAAKTLNTFIRNYLSREVSLTAKDLSLSGKLDVSCCTIDRNGITEGQWKNTLQDFVISAEDYFTLIHQNLIVLISKYAFKHNMNLVEYFPDNLKDLHNSLPQDWQTLSIDANFPDIIFNYNIPLAAHSAKLSINYNIQSQKMTLDYNTYGVNQFNRWSNSVEYLFIQLQSFLDEDYVTIIKEPKFNNKTASMNCKVSVSSFEYALKFIEFVKQINNNSFSISAQGKPFYFINLLVNDLQEIKKDDISKYHEAIDKLDKLNKKSVNKICLLEDVIEICFEETVREMFDESLSFAVEENGFKKILKLYNKAFYKALDVPSKFAFIDIVKKYGINSEKYISSFLEKASKFSTSFTSDIGWHSQYYDEAKATDSRYEVYFKNKNKPFHFTAIFDFEKESIKLSFAKNYKNELSVSEIDFSKQVMSSFSELMKVESFDIKIENNTINFNVICDINQFEVYKELLSLFWFSSGFYNKKDFSDIIKKSIPDDYAKFLQKDLEHLEQIFTNEIFSNDSDNTDIVGNNVSDDFGEDNQISLV